MKKITWLKLLLINLFLLPLIFFAIKYNASNVLADENRNNNNFLSRDLFWNNRGGGVDTGTLVDALFTSGGAYTNNRNGYQGCEISQDTGVIFLDAGTDTIPEYLSGNMIYVLNEGNYTTTRPINFSGNCIGFVGYGNVLIYSSGDTQTGFNITDKSYLILDNIKINGTGNGVQLNNGIVYNNVSYTTINNVSLYNNISSAFLINNSYGNIINNSSGYNNSIGIYVENSSGNIFTGLTIYSNSGNGMSLSGSDSNIFSNLQTYSNTGNGIYILNSNNNSVSNSRFYNNVNYGAYFDGGSGNVINSVSGFNNGYEGLFFQSNNSTITNSNFYGNETLGARIQGTNNNVSNITSSGNSGHGVILLLSGSTITNIQSTNNVEKGILITSSYNNIFSGLTSARNLLDGIWLYGNSNTFTNIISSSNTGNGITIYDGETNIFNIANSYSNLGNGLDIQNPSSINEGNSITNSNFYSNTGDGIIISGSQNNLLSGINSYSNYAGIEILNSSNGNSIVNSNIYSNQSVGLSVDDGDTNNFTNISSSGNIGNGFSLINGSSGNLITSFIGRNNDYGIYVQNSSNNTLSGINSYNNISGGVIIDTANNNILNNIISSGNSIFGLGISAGSGNAISSFQSHNNTGAGLILNSSTNNILSGITAYSNSDNGIKLTDSDYNTISNSQTYNNTGRGIYFNNSNFGTINLTTIYNNTNNGLYLSGSSNNAINNSQSYSNTGIGIYLSNSSNNTINNSKVYNHISEGILLINSSSNSINNSQTYNNDHGISLLFGNGNAVNNSQSYNNDHGIGIEYSSSNIINAVQTYNNGYGIGIGEDSTGNQYYGTLKVFSNNSGNFDGTSGNDQYLTGGTGIYFSSLGRSSGTLLTGISMSWNYITNPIYNSSYLLNWNSGFTYFMGNQIWTGTYPINYSYGSQILKQIQPVIYSGTSLITGLTYSSLQFIGSDMTVISGSLTANNYYTTGPVILTYSTTSLTNYQLFGDITNLSSGTISTSGSISVIFTGSDGTKNIVVQFYTGNIFATHYATTITLDNTVPAMTGTTLSGSNVTSGGYYNTGVSFTFYDTNLSGATLYSGNDTTGTNYTSGQIITGQATYRLVVSDFAGNITSKTFTIDAVNPSTTFISPTSGSTITGSATVQFIRSGSDFNMSGYNLYLYNSGSLVYTSTQITGTTLSLFMYNGTYSGYIIAQDFAGNTGISNINIFTVNVPLQGIITLTGSNFLYSGGQAYVKNPISLILTTNKISYYTITGDIVLSTITGIVSTSTISFNLTGSDATKNIYVQFYTGNETTYNTGLSLILDSAGPTTPTLSSPTSGGNIIGTGNLIWSASVDSGVGISGYYCYVSTSPIFASNFTSGFTSGTGLQIQNSVSTSGTLYWYVVAVDKLGNTGTSSTIQSFIYTPILDIISDSFSFDQITNAKLDKVYKSDTITIAGLSDSTQVLAQLTKGALYINGTFVGTTGMVQNGSTVYIELISSDEYETSVTSTLSIGSRSARFKITTKSENGTSSDNTDCEDDDSCDLTNSKKLQIISIFNTLKNIYSDSTKQNEFVALLKTKLQENIDYYQAQIDNDSNSSSVDTLRVQALQYLYDLADNYLGNTNTIYGYTNTDPKKHVAPNGKVYTITYNSSTKLYTSPNFIYPKTFKNLQDLRSYIDINNGGTTYYSSSTTDSVDTSRNASYVAPNGKFYKIYRTTDGRYSSYNFIYKNYFDSFESTKNYIYINNKK
ncbi:MAG: right-handed parallel beta-helix repeat-containing protein [Candidatus Absconditabacterales bacterium]